MPDYTIDSSSGTVTITSLTKIVFQVGSNSITIDTSGVTIAGMNIKQTADIQHSVSCVTAEVSASAEYKNGSTLIQLG